MIMRMVQQKHSQKPYHDQKTGTDHENRRARRRRRLQNIALSTIHAINKKIVDVSKTVRLTRYYPPDYPELINWKTPPTYCPFSLRFAKISIASMSSLEGICHFHRSSSAPRRIGVLNFASATQPGGGFLQGALAQEESIARSSTLYVSLMTPNAQPFYALHDQDEKDGYYTHAMIYSPNIHILRDDDGTWLTPHQVDVLTCPAVNAGQVRKAFQHLDPTKVEFRITEIMYERIARILALFERKGARNLVLGSFGTGVFQNNIRAMARVWKTLLLGQDARFGKAFEQIVFAIPDGDTRQGYEMVFQGRDRP